MHQQPAVCLTALLLFVLFTDTAAAATKTICSHQIPSLVLCSLHARFTMEQLAPRFPQYTWRYKFIGGVNATPRDYTALWLQHASQCDALLGPGFSSLALAVSSVVNVPWIDWSATSTQLSDSAANPTFARVIPTDATGARMIAPVVRRFGWKAVGVLCVDGAYGNSVTSGVVDAMTQIGGVIEYSRCVAAQATMEEVRTALAIVMAANTRVLVIAMNSNAAPFQHFKQLYLAQTLRKEVTLFFSESFCSKHVPDLYLFPGSFCATYAVNATLAGPYDALFRARNTSQDAADLAALGYNVSAMNLTGKDVFSVFAHDATQHLMAAIVSYPNSTSASIFAHLRSQVTQGMTGAVRLSGNDRVAADGVVLNIINDGTAATIGSVVGGSFTPSDYAAANGVFVRDTSYAMDRVPAEVRPKSTSAAGISAGTVILICVSVFITTLLIFFANRLMKSKRFKDVLNPVGLVALNLAFLCGSMILYCFSVYEVIIADLDDRHYVIWYIVLTVIAIIMSVVEGVAQLQYFWLQVHNDQLEDKIVVWWNAHLVRIKLWGILLKDIPQICLSFTGVVKLGAGGFVFIASMVVGCIFVGTKLSTAYDEIMELKDKLYERHFKTLRRVARFVLMMVHIRGKKFVSDQSERPELTKGCAPSMIENFRSDLKENNTRRYRILRHRAQKIALSLQDLGLTQNEYYGVIEQDLAERFVRENWTQQSTYPLRPFYVRFTSFFESSVNGNPLAFTTSVKPPLDASASHDKSKLHAGFHAAVPIARPTDAKPTSYRSSTTRKSSLQETIVLEDMEDD